MYLFSPLRTLSSSFPRSLASCLYRSFADETDKTKSDKKGKTKAEKVFSAGTLFGTGKTRNLDLSVRPSEAEQAGKSKAELKALFKKEKKLKEAEANKAKAGLAAAMRKGQMGEKEKYEVKEREVKFNLYQLCRRLPNNGMGLRVYRSLMTRYEEPSYWNIVYVAPPSVLFFVSGLNMQEKHKCRIYGVLTWRGKTNLLLKRIPRVAQKDWSCLEVPYAQLLPPIPVTTGKDAIKATPEPVPEPEKQSN